MDKREPGWLDSLEMPCLQGTADGITVPHGTHRGRLRSAMQVVWARAYYHKSTVFRENQHRAFLVLSSPQVA